MCRCILHPKWWNGWCSYSTIRYGTTTTVMQKRNKSKVICFWWFLYFSLNKLQDLDFFFFFFFTLRSIQWLNICTEIKSLDIWEEKRWLIDDATAAIIRAKIALWMDILIIVIPIDRKNLPIFGAKFLQITISLRLKLCRIRCRTHSNIDLDHNLHGAVAHQYNVYNMLLQQNPDKHSF